MNPSAQPSRADTIAALPIFLLVFSALVAGTGVWFLVFGDAPWIIGAAILAVAVGLMVLALKVLAKQTQKKNEEDRHGQ